MEAWPKVEVKLEMQNIRFSHSRGKEREKEEHTRTTNSKPLTDLTKNQQHQTTTPMPTLQEHKCTPKIGFRIGEREPSVRRETENDTKPESE